MNERKVIVIEQNVDDQNIVNDELQKRKLRVCAYARVSTDLEEQSNSYQTQINEFTKMIEAKSDWLFVKMYSDEGISGTSLKKRAGFLEMIQDARDGKIDMIITKSLSRFARNTVDALTIIREMREKNVEIYFEKENLYTSDTSIDFIITVHSSIAQEESRNISQNIKWAYKKKFERGEIQMNWKSFLGYCKSDDGSIQIVDDEALTVKMIYNLFLADKTYREIIEFLNKTQRVNGRGIVKWHTSTIKLILENEKYCGDVISQKTYTVDYLTHKSARNDGQVNKYYIADHHPAIIPRETWNLVQELKKSKADIFYSDNNTSRTNKNHFTGKVYCYDCKLTLQRTRFNINRTLGTYRIALTCKKRNRNNAERNCCAKPIDNDMLEFAVVEAMSKYVENEKDINEELLKLLSEVDQNDDINNEITKSNVKIIEIENNMNELVSLRLSGTSTFSDTELTNKYETLTSNLEKEKEYLESLKKQTVAIHKSNSRINEIRLLMNSNNSVDKIKLYCDRIAKIIVVTNEKVVICLESTPFTDEGFLDKMEAIIDYDPIISGMYCNTVKQKRVDYKIVRIGDEIDE